MYYSKQFAFLVLLLYLSSLEISDMTLRSSDVGIRVSDVDASHLGEESPPLPVLEFEVTGTVPLNDLHGAQLLLTFTESPKKTNKQTKHLESRSISKQSAGSELALLAGQEASGLCLEGDDDDGQFEIPLLLQLGQNSSPEEHFTLTDAIEVGIQLQVFYLEENSLLQPHLAISVLTW